jgi:AcrR family transcriptional regulator
MARKVGLAAAHVSDAAVAVADAEGLDAVTLARVAAALGVRPPSLYSHVEGLAGLRRAVALRSAVDLGAALASAVEGRQGAQALRAMAGAYRTFATAHPGRYASLLPSPGPDDAEAAAAFAAPVQTVARVLVDLGVPDAEVVPHVRAFRSALHGFVSLEAGGGFGLPFDVDASFATMVEMIITGILTRTT